ncbi:MAG: HNH endonuclease, partial [Bacteroidales bacterium]|nr:HNH endonuclease [Bacteroidales bacterium]
QVNMLILHFEQLVPYRFLSPWIKGTKNEIIKRSQYFENNCLYRFNNDGVNSIEINPDWVTYLNKNNKILLDYTYWNLNLFLQVRNPNIPDVAGKLIKPISRSSLIKQRNFWNIVLNEIEAFNCIYTGKTLTVDNFDMEHFIPWSFVAHDQLWNLLPSDSSINSSKSNKLPLLDKYLESFVEAQYQAINTVYRKQPHNKLLEDYLILGTNISDIAKTPLLDFKNKYYNTLSPLVQIANNSGFEFWER